MIVLFYALLVLYLLYYRWLLTQAIVETYEFGKYSSIGDVRRIAECINYPATYEGDLPPFNAEVDEDFKIIDHRENLHYVKNSRSN